jgi:hypothetical protein
VDYIWVWLIFLLEGELEDVRAVDELFRYLGVISVCPVNDISRCFVYSKDEA